MTANQPKKSIKKRIILALAAVVGVVAISVTSVLATVAYLTSSAAVSNVFTIGNVGISMTESKVTPEGVRVSPEERTDTNTYHLVPNKTYIKDPVLTVNPGSDSSYLFVLVRNDLEAIECKEHTGEGEHHQTIAQQLAANGWMKFTAASTGWVYVYVGVNNVPADNYKVDLKEGSSYVFAGNATPVSTNSTEVKSFKLFDTFSIDADANVSAYGAAKITLTAVAIQTAGFGTNAEIGTPNAVKAAWEAVIETYPYIHTGTNSQGSGSNSQG